MSRIITKSEKKAHKLERANRKKARGKAWQVG